MDVWKLEPEPYVDSRPAFSFSGDKVINMKEEEPPVPTACSLVERKVEVSYMLSSYTFACHPYSYSSMFIEILYVVFIP
jgi:hypothetical protein